ncbi:hypothetical protein B9Z19DRAFT_1076957 [Tuber borchii]|uniref:Uncharacterized protein n=1 Tax=Tuber borchii TaxID=42251 RepID=A0A2T7A152_TUBBO|nr:hypothetical protein B9Z19DRAFT_1076957 [Tuber borchii]
MMSHSLALQPKKKVILRNALPFFLFFFTIFFFPSSTGARQADWRDREEKKLRPSPRGCSWLRGATSTIVLLTWAVCAKEWKFFGLRCWGFGWLDLEGGFLFYINFY